MRLLHFKVSPGLRNDSIVTLAYLWQGWWEASGIRGLRNHSVFQALRYWGRRESVGRAKMGAGLLGVAFFFLVRAFSIPRARLSRNLEQAREITPLTSDHYPMIN